MKANNTTENRVKCYNDSEMAAMANKLREAGFNRVENAYWVEHWRKGNELIILERGDESERPTTIEPATDNTPATAKPLTVSILDELTARKCRGAWDNAVNAYAVEPVESLDNWDKQPESVAELREMMLNGAADWQAYSRGGSSLIYNWDIAERLCTPSELRRLTRKDGTLNDRPRGVHLLDHQARAPYQAANRVANIAAKYFNA